MDTSTRLLRLLTLFSSRPSWTAAELIDRLAVTDRTLRRDVTRLRELGYPIVGSTGPYGGYELGAGGRMPPLLLDDDEAVAVSVALRERARESDSALGEAALSALAKLRQVLPPQLRERVEALDDVLVGIHRPGDEERTITGIATLLGLAVASRRQQRVAFAYRDNAGRETERRVEPHRLVTSRRSWYLVGYDLDRDDWRTFRVDRISDLVDTGHRNTPREVPDAAAKVAEGIALYSYGLTARVRVHVPPAMASRLISPTAGVVEPDDSPDATSCIVRIGGDAEWIAHYLARIEHDYEVLDPPEVRAALRRLGRRLQAANTD